MLRWLGALVALSALTAMLGWGVIPTSSAGLARTLFTLFAGLLSVSLVFGIARR